MPPSLVAAELRRYGILALRYPVETLVGVVVTMLVFLGLFAGGRYLAGPASAFGSSADVLIVGYFAWLVLVSGLGHLAGEIEGDGKEGVLEAVMSSTHTPLALFAARAVAGLVLAVATSAVACAGVAALLGQWPAPRAVALVPLATLAVTALGLGLAAGGLALHVKRIGLVLAPLYLLFLPLMMVRFESMGGPFAAAAFLLPSVPSAALLRAAALPAAPLEAADVLFAAASAVAWLAIGLATFAAGAGIARRRGVIGMH